MTARAPSLGAFVLRTVLLLPPCFAAWYFIAPYHATVAGALAVLMVDLFRPGIVSALERSGTDLVFVTTLQVNPSPGQVGVLLPEVDPLLYTFGLGFFLALMLASRVRWWKILAGVALLLPFQSWGIALDFLAQVAIRLGPGIRAQTGFSAWQAEAIALGYQVGTLILPTLVPVVLWALFSREFIESLLRSRAPGAANQPR